MVNRIDKSYLIKISNFSFSKERLFLPKITTFARAGKKSKLFFKSVLNTLKLFKIFDNSETPSFEAAEERLLTKWSDKFAAHIGSGTRDAKT